MLGAYTMPFLYFLVSTNNLLRDSFENPVVAITIFTLILEKIFTFLIGKTGYYEMNDVLNLGKVLTDYVEGEDMKRYKRYGQYNVESEDTKEFWA